MRFLNLDRQDKVPDAKTVWAFRERLTKAKTIDALFSRFDTALRNAGYIAMSGQLVDNTLGAAPKQRLMWALKVAASAAMDRRFGRSSRSVAPRG